MSDTDPNETAPSEKPRQSFSRSQTIGAVILVVSILVMAIGWQQVMFQKRFTAAAACYDQWGKDVTKALEKRSTANNAQTKAERAKGEAVDNILLLFLNFRKAEPPLTEKQREAQFNDSLDAFGKAKAKQVEADQKNIETKRENAYPQLNCDK